MPPFVSTIQENNSHVKYALTSHIVGQKMNVVDALPDNLKKTKGRPKGSGKLTMAKYADAKPIALLPKTENQRVKELKELLKTVLVLMLSKRLFRLPLMMTTLHRWLH